MESQQAFIQNGASTVLSSTPTHGVRKLVIRFKTPTNTNTMILNGDSSSACSKEMERSSCLSNAEKMRHGKRGLDMDCKTEFQENIKKPKRQIDVASTTSNAHYNCSVTRSDDIKKPTDTFKKRKVKRKSLVMSFVNSQGAPACPICRTNCVSKKFLYEHMVLHTDKDWKTFIRSLDTHKIDKNQSHEPTKVVDLSKFLIRWNVKKGKRCRRLGSSVADLKVNNYLRLGRYDLGEGDEDMKEAAKILLLMSRDRQLKSKTSMAKPREEAAAKCLMCLDNPVSPLMVESGAQVTQLMATSMTERTVQVEELADNGAIKGLRGFDLNELPAFDEDLV